MVRMVYRVIEPSIVAGSFEAKPKIFYRAGKGFGRNEEEFDSKNKNQALMVANGPKIWMINLFTKSGKYIIDESPTHAFHAPILPIPPLEQDKNNIFEYGQEMEFFAKNHAKKGAKETIEGVKCDSLELDHVSFHLVLYIGADSHLPVKLNIYQKGQMIFALRYLEYQPKLPFNATLFQPPGGLKLEEDVD